MPPYEKSRFSDFYLLDEASAALLGYFVHTWYGHYLGVILTNLKRWRERGVIRGLAEPTERGCYAELLDFKDLNMEKIAYINGIYFYILSCHKAANYRLMNRHEGKQVLYLRGFDFEHSVSLGGKQAMGSSSVDTTLFNWTLGEHLAPHFQVFKALSPKDVYWETVDAQRYFYGDFADMIPLAKQRFASIYLNALHWKEDIAHLFDRMDHFVVYVSSITESVLWELDQLDTDDRRGRVTVVFDEPAIENKEVHLGFQDKMQDHYGDKLIWSNNPPLPNQSVAELREQLSRKFLLTTPDAFEKEIEAHRRRIAESSAHLPPGARETWLDFRFYPALAPEKLEKLRDFSAWLQAETAACIGERGIVCLPLFLNQVQLRIFMTLLMGEHHETGCALGAYAAVMQGMIGNYDGPKAKIGDVSAEFHKRHLDLLQDHLDMARHIGTRMLSFGKSHQFDDFSAIATADFAAAFDTTKAAVAKFFETWAARHAS